MRPRFRLALLVLFTLLGALAVAGWLYVRHKQPQRQGELALPGLSAPVQVRFDERGVPHLQASNEPDLYRALGWVHASHRLFQMEMLRRLARGELAEVLGEKLLPTDRLMRTLRLNQRAQAQAQALPADHPAAQALSAYLDGINQFQATQPLPPEFDLLGISPRPYTPVDSYAVMGYLAYSFAAGLRTEPLVSHLHQHFGPRWREAFEPVLRATSGRAPTQVPARAQAQMPTLVQLAELGQAVDEARAWAAQPLLMGSNGWVLGPQHSRSGRAVLAGDPHIAYALPAVWFEAHLQAPGFELYGYFNALIPMALLGHNQRFGWTLTMFLNDDMDLVLEPSPAPGQPAWPQRQERVAVKGQAPVMLTLRDGPHGPIVNDALPPGTAPTQPVALWWTWLVSDNPLLQAFYLLNRADSLSRAREAASLIHAPGLNILWAHADGDIAWWAAARLPLRPPGTDPTRLLDGTLPEADKLGFQPFADNPHEENPARGWIVSANQAPEHWPAVPGYYAPAERAQRLAGLLRSPPAGGWTPEQMVALQQDAHSHTAVRVLAAVLPDLLAAEQAGLLPRDERPLLTLLARWQGQHDLALSAPTLYHQFIYELLRAAWADDLPEPWFGQALKLRRLDEVLLRLVLDPDAPWWDRRDTPAVEHRAQIVLQAWQAALAHLRATLGPQVQDWTWGRAHTLTHPHPLGRLPVLGAVLNVGPLPVPGGRELVNNQAHAVGPAPWAVNQGPSTRRVVDFGAPGPAQGGTPVGQSGVWGDAHYDDQALAHARGWPRPMHLNEADVASHTRSRLLLRPGP